MKPHSWDGEGRCGSCLSWPLTGLETAAGVLHLPSLGFLEGDATARDGEGELPQAMSITCRLNK